MQFRDHHQEVTGITVNHSPNVSRRYVRQIRAMLHAWKKYGHDAAEDEFRKKYDRRSRNPDHTPPSFRRVVRGKLDYLKMVKGRRDKTYLALVSKLRDLDPYIAPVISKESDEADDAAGDDAVWKKWAKEYEDLVFMVDINNEGDGPFYGTAFMYGPNELASCAHVLDDGDPIVYLADGTKILIRKYDMARHKYGTTDVDAVRVKVPALSQNRYIPSRPLSSPVQRGDQVLVLGFPTLPGVQPELSIRDGIVEAVTKDRAEKVELVIVSIRISGGLSGGPVIDRQGRLVGIAMQKNYEKAADGVPAVPIFPLLSVRHLSEIR